MRDSYIPAAVQDLIEETVKAYIVLSPPHIKRRCAEILGQDDLSLREKQLVDTIIAELKPPVKKPRKKVNRRKMMDEVASLCGLTKVRGAVSGKVYYE